MDKNSKLSFITVAELKKSLFAALWFMFLTFPIMVIKVNTVTDVVEWRWLNLLLVGVSTFILSWVWRRAMAWKLSGGAVQEEEEEVKLTLRERLMERKKLYRGLKYALLAFVIAFPFFSGMYQTNIMITALLYVMLALGLNIVIGLGGMLHLGYVAFYAVGAYSYALLNLHFGVSFWLAIPIGALLAMLFGIFVALPVIRLRGDYLAIVTLAFGEIVRIVLENWNDFSFGPSGIANIPRPDLFGIDFSLQGITVVLYFVVLLMVLFTIFVVIRLEDSRLGRSWIAMREDEIASKAMGINITKAKVTAFALGAFWAGMAGVVFAAKTTFINPASFTVWESIIILSMVVLGGMGSIPGVTLGALILILLPEYLRAFSEYRMLIFGICLVLMMVFKSEGMIPALRKRYTFKADGTREGT